ncbi:hypothetical protein CWR48_03440 [Oceanobacillus arenosus]|uniref:NERD domain-containing protein n=2 Tax=Oceanobacillus arenosus TaxID=1229153 RepID=A0A3D8PZL5_9BACI|nr:hypothetical protein CWR48_03440 [Oceanobacillus arenosus]
MIVKKLAKPLLLKKYEALLPRLMINSPTWLDANQEFNRRMRGYKGEIRVGYYLSGLAQKYTILQDVCLGADGQTFQMDDLIISPHAIYIVEAKNYHGTITFDHILKQLIRHDGEKETGFAYPITQVELQHDKLQNWLHDHSSPNLPIYYFVAISEPSTIIKVIGNQQEVAEIVAHAAMIPKKIMEIEERLAASEKVQHQKIGYMIMKECTEFDLDIFAQHKITPSNLLTGVQCPECGSLGIERVHSGWICHKCQKKYAAAHKAALEDYFLLIKPWITNTECMQWLKLDSRNTATRILKSSNLFFNSKRRWWERKEM